MVILYFYQPFCVLAADELLSVRTVPRVQRSRAAWLRAENGKVSRIFMQMPIIKAVLLPCQRGPAQRYVGRGGSKTLSLHKGEPRRGRDPQWVEKLDGLSTSGCGGRVDFASASP